MTLEKTAQYEPEARPRPRAASSKMRVAPSKDFVILVSPTEIDLIDGEALPRLIRFPVEPGIMGIPGVKEFGDPVLWEPAVAFECGRTGRILVDPRRYGITIKVKGETIEPMSGEDLNDPRVHYVRRYAGHKGTVHVSVWQIPRTVGSQTNFKTDKAGETDFRRQIAKKIFGGVDSDIATKVREQAEDDAVEMEIAAKTHPRHARNAKVAKAALGKPKKTKK